MSEKRYRKPGEFPAGEEDFVSLRQRGCVYVDKTAYMYNMVQMKYIFLSRPRRFGKSLLCSTLEAYFQGKRELFKGLAIDSPEMETEWKQYPVLRFCISLIKDMRIEEMTAGLESQLIGYERIYGRDESAKTCGSRLKALIERAHQQTGLQTVVIIDEYDSPMLKHMHDTKENIAEVRRILQEFYGPLKACAADLRFVFITGITKFSQMSIFSTINNLTNISMDTAYAHLCGITQSEFDAIFMDDVEHLAQTLKMTTEQCYAELKRWYDGYHFCEGSEDIYNPYSVMKVFAQQKIRDYWFDSGTCTFLLDEMKRLNTQILKVDGTEVPDNAFNQPVQTMTNALPLIYQSGYLTVKDYDDIIKTYTLGIPNNEVRTGLMENILPMMTQTNASDNTTYSTGIIASLKKNQYDEAMEYLRAFLSSIPYLQQGEPLLEDLERLEVLYQNYLYIFFHGMGYQVRTEPHMAKGRVDEVLWIGDHIFVFEFKMSASCQSAIDQIDTRQYIEPWRCGPVRITKCAVQFSAKDRTIKDWKFVEVED